MLYPYDNIEGEPLSAYAEAGFFNNKRQCKYTTLPIRKQGGKRKMNDLLYEFHRRMVERREALVGDPALKGSSYIDGYINSLSDMIGEAERMFDHYEKEMEAHYIAEGKV